MHRNIPKEILQPKYIHQIDLHALLLQFKQKLSLQKTIKTQMEWLARMLCSFDSFPFPLVYGSSI